MKQQLNRVSGGDDVTTLTHSSSVTGLAQFIFRQQSERETDSSITGSNLKNIKISKLMGVSSSLLARAFDIDTAVWETPASCDPSTAVRVLVHTYKYSSSAQLYRRCLVVERMIRTY